MNRGLWLAVLASVGVAALTVPRRPARDAVTTDGRAAGVSKGSPAASVPPVGEGPPSAPLLTARTPEQLREVYTFARDADSDDVPGLSEMALRSSDPLVVGNAVRALGRLGALDEVEVLELLGDPRLRVRQEAIRAIGGRHSPELALRLRPALEDPGTRLLAIRALGRLGGEDARELLRALRPEPGAGDVEVAFVREALAQLERPLRVPNSAARRVDAPPRGASTLRRE